MNDTPKHILQKQFEIIYAKPLGKKIAEEKSQFLTKELGGMH